VTGHRALRVGDVITIAEHSFAVRWRNDTDLPREVDSDEDGEDRPKRRWFWPFS